MPRSPAHPPVADRSVVMGSGGMVATSQPLAALEGALVLARGGSAADAAIAANAVMGFLEPTGNGVGGDLFALVYDAARGEVTGLNASGWSPAGLEASDLRRQGHREMPRRGIHSVTVPGAVAGWGTLHARYGRLPLADLLAPAIHHAEAGAPVAPVTASLWAAYGESLADDPVAAATFLPGGRAPAPGERFRNPDLAATLRRVAEHGASGFYEGPIADALVGLSRAEGGALGYDDLADYRAEWVTPVRCGYQGWTVYQVGPQTQGVAALMMLGIMDRYPLAEWGFHSADALHVMIEAKKLAYADMVANVGDPRFVDDPTAALLDPDRLAARADGIDMRRAAERVEPARLAGVTDRAGGDTICLAVADREGTVVSLIQSNYEGFGSGLVPRGTGFMLQNRGALFTLEPGHPNALEPRKRPLHTLIPGFMERGGVRIGFGIMGGWNQAQAHAQFVSHIVDSRLDIQQALDAGRFTKPTFDGTDVECEGSVPAGARAELERRGHDVNVHGPRTPIFGYGHAVMSDGPVRYGAADPRHDGAAIPEPAPGSAAAPITSSHSSRR